MKAEIEKRAQKDRMHNHVRFIGRPAMAGYRIAATDGTVALLELGKGTGEPCGIFDGKASRVHCAITDPEFHNVIKRALIMAEDSGRLQLLCSIGPDGKASLKVYSKHEAPSETNDAGDFLERLELQSGEAFHFAMNGRFIEAVCGSYPLRIWFQGPNHPVMFESENGEFRYIVSPFGDDLKPELRADLESFGYDPVSESENQKPAPDDVPGPEHIATAAEAEELGTAGALRSDTCPICGDWIRISERITADGRLIGTCGDAFTRAQWDNDPAGYDPVSKSEDPATEKPAEVAPAAELPQEPPQEAPAAELHAEAVYPTYVRLVIGEAVSQDAAAAVVCRMKDNIKAIVRLSQGSAMQEFGSCMVLLTLEFQNLHDAINYSKSKPYESLCTETNHFLLGSYVHKLFEKTGE
jgi:hypothetical protein